jgi:hypothetical protein
VGLVSESWFFEIFGQCKQRRRALGGDVNKWHKRPINEWRKRGPSGKAPLGVIEE